MSTATSSAVNEAAIVYGSRPYSQREWSWNKFASIAATVAIVLAVSVGGWFATMQLNSPDGSDGAFGLFGQSNSEATCDVEPLTVDEVLQRMEHPFGTNVEEEEYADWMRGEQRRRVLWVSDTPVWPHNYVDQGLIDSFDGTPDEESFAIAYQQMNHFLACGQNGSVGQLFRFIRPFEIQRIVLSELPLFRDEADARAVLEELLPTPASGLIAWSDSAFTEPEYTFAANSDISQAATSNTTHSVRFGATETIMIGISVTNQSGEVVFQNDYLGRVNPAGPLMTTERFRVIMAESLIDEQWYVLAVIPE